MASAPEYTKENIRAKLDSELSLEERKSFLQGLITTPGCPILLIEVANNWHLEMINLKLDILKSIGAIQSRPHFFGAAKRLDTAADVIDKTLTGTTQKQIAFEKSATYAELTLQLLGELLGVVGQEEITTNVPKI